MLRYSANACGHHVLCLPARLLMLLGTLWFVRLFTLNDLDATGGDYYLTTLQEAIVDNVLRQNPFNKLVRWCPILLLVVDINLSFHCLPLCLSEAAF